MADYTPNPWILDEIAANRKWMVEMVDGMPTECLTSCAKEIESLRAELAKRTDERDEARQEVCRRQKRSVVFDEALAEANRRGWDCFKEDGNAN